mmetsp:Transcript_66701/g.211017  ORF Transcript_66701/g.211017 Transcript_66701/m.211017 type:complete len:253 (+) Transcript_66701:340-1098(+)
MLLVPSAEGTAAHRVRNLLQMAFRPGPLGYTRRCRTDSQPEGEVAAEEGPAGLLLRVISGLGRRQVLPRRRCGTRRLMGRRGVLPPVRGAGGRLVGRCQGVLLPICEGGDRLAGRCRGVLLPLCGGGGRLVGRLGNIALGWQRCSRKSRLGSGFTVHPQGLPDKAEEHDERPLHGGVADGRCRLEDLRLQHLLRAAAPLHGLQLRATRKRSEHTPVLGGQGPLSTLLHQRLDVIHGSLVCADVSSGDMAAEH